LFSPDPLLLPDSVMGSQDTSQLSGTNRFLDE